MKFIPCSFCWFILLEGMILFLLTCSFTVISFRHLWETFTKIGLRGGLNRFRKPCNEMWRKPDKDNCGVRHSESFAHWTYRRCSACFSSWEQENVNLNGLWAMLSRGQSVTDLCWGPPLVTKIFKASAANCSRDLRGWKTGVLIATYASHTH